MTVRGWVCREENSVSRRRTAVIFGAVVLLAAGASFLVASMVWRQRFWPAVTAMLLPLVRSVRSSADGRYRASSGSAGKVWSCHSSREVSSG